MGQHNYSNSLIYHNYILIFCNISFFFILYTENPVPEFYKMAGILTSSIFSGIGIRGIGMVFQIVSGSGGAIIIITTTPPIMIVNAKLTVNGSICNIPPGSGVCNTSYGVNALDSLTTGSDNTAVGQDALTANTTASNNTAVGCRALDVNATASDNTAVGADSLGANDTGICNTAVGSDSLLSNTSCRM